MPLNIRSPGRGTIVIAPDKFKGSLSASHVALAIERGLRHIWQNRYAVEIIPMADGGEGTVAAFIEGGASAAVARVHGPLGAPVDATFARDGELAVIEMASASGLALLTSDSLDPLRASTFGTGELILAALNVGATHIVVGIGGSATNDGGAGMLAALGARFLDEAGQPLEPGGAALRRLASIDLSQLDPRLRDMTIDVAADVDNLLCGEAGASAVFGPQKGASPAAVAMLDVALAHYADVAARAVGRDDRELRGAGAAGGLGFGFAAFLNARLRPGVAIVAELRGLDAALARAWLCLSGEGRIDQQTLRGKTVAGVADIAQRHNVPVIALAGTLEAAAEDALYARGVACLPIIAGPTPLEAAMSESAILIERAAARVARLLDRPIA